MADVAYLLARALLVRDPLERLVEALEALVVRERLADVGRAVVVVGPLQRRVEEGDAEAGRDAVQ
jgi:hypothetical protein